MRVANESDKEEKYCLEVYEIFCCSDNYCFLCFVTHLKMSDDYFLTSDTDKLVPRHP